MSPTQDDITEIIARLKEAADNLKPAWNDFWPVHRNRDPCEANLVVNLAAVLAPAWHLYGEVHYNETIGERRKLDLLGIHKDQPMFLACEIKKNIFTSKGFHDLKKSKISD